MAERQKLLVVDDDRLIVQMLTDLFVDHYDVVTASNGEEALSKLEAETFAGVLCDHVMPGVTGVEVLQVCLERQPKAARILVTASEDVKDVRDAINLARVHRVVAKPFRHVEIEGIVRGAIREHSLEQENARLVGELQDALAEVKKREIELEHELQVRTQELQDVMKQLMPRAE